MSAAPKTTCIKCGPKTVLVDRLPPLTRPIAGVENGREYSSITWYKLRCPECGTCKNLRCPAFVDEKAEKVGARGNMDTGKIATHQPSSPSPKTDDTRGRQRGTNRRNRRTARNRTN